MPHVKRLIREWPTPPKPDTPQCAMPVSDPPGATRPNWRQWRYGENGSDPTRCQRRSVVEIDGEPFCGIHGGQVALGILLSQSEPPRPEEPPYVLNLAVTRRGSA